MQQTPSNDLNYDPRDQLATLSEEEAITYAQNIIDQNCDEKDASFMKALLVAGEQAQIVTYEHAVLGSAAAQLVYGAAKLNGSHTDQNVAEGLFWLRRAHNNGNSKASVVLCGTYLEGKHISRNPKKALEYIIPAADKGLPAAMYILANMLLSGETMPIDEDRAITILKESARSGYAPALKMLEDNDIPLE